MSARMITITRTDLHRLTEILDSELTLAIVGQRAHLRELRENLQRATVVESPDMLPDVVTMNSTVYVHDLDRSETDVYTLVYPEEACIAEGKLSILSPLGVEILGRRVGEAVTVHVLDRESRKRIDKLSFQPERVGAFHL
ncbi:GreA/GreB family elongation factor [Aureliella helgolandensis]|uniref:Regulator of nucleoside diphosphate kinase n=1 Tax=Aureliella helgolandensis TaxID=2527968 RepID=A0A518GCU2_9BACT|nr:GreA/GreB family elongation factor [Aureliella helgolandensis]QDV26393.1 Regulator of nucleoside diphosphate kinase [Aureliella helgolandensis]